jgi:site-specific DNA recombinase
MQPGGKCFGYRNVPIEDPTRTGKYGHAAVSGVKMEFDKVEAPIVRRVFAMYDDGNSLATIAKILNTEGVRHLSRLVPGRLAWHPSPLREMLRNELKPKSTERSGLRRAHCAEVRVR